MGKDLLGKATLPFRGNQAIENAAGRKVVQAIEKSGKSIEDVQKGLDEGVVANQMIADVGTGTQRLGRGSAAISGDGQDIAEKALNARQMDLGDEIANDVNKVFDVNKSSADAIDEIIDRQRANASIDYEKAFNVDGNPVTVSTDKIKPFLDLPVFDEAIEQAQKLAKLDGFTTPTNLSDINKFDNISLKELHYIKMGVDEVLGLGKRGQAKSSIGRESERRIKAKRNDFIKIIDDASPKVDGKSSYQSARNKFADDARIREAVELGKKFERLQPDEIKRIIKRSSEGEKKGLLIGVADQIRNSVDSAKDMANKADKIFGSDLKKKRLAELFPSEKAFSQFEKRMKARINQVKTRTTVNVGSRTAPLGEDIADVKGGLGMFLTGIPSVRDIAGTVAGLAKGTPDAVSSRISRDLFDTNAVTQRETLARLAKLRDQMIRSNNRAGNITGGFTGGLGALLGGSAGRNINDG